MCMNVKGRQVCPLSDGEPAAGPCVMRRGPNRAFQSGGVRAAARRPTSIHAGRDTERIAFSPGDGRGHPRSSAGRDTPARRVAAL